MKNRYFILSVLFWAVASVSMAITLPSSSYSGSIVDEANYSVVQLGTGSSFVGTPLLFSANNIDVDTKACTTEGTPKDPSECAPCCFRDVYKPCMEQTGNDVTACGALNETCNKSCANGSSLPLGTPLLLLPFALGYAVVRRNRKETV